MTPPKRRRPIDFWFAAWFAFVAVLTLICLGVGIWAVISLVNFITGGAA